jgi:hypothetical protein
MEKNIPEMQPTQIPRKEKVNAEFKELLNKVNISKRLDEYLKKNVNSEREKWNILLRHKDY